MREQFIKEVETILKSFGFSKNEDGFTRIGYSSAPQQTIVVNGQLVKQDQRNDEIRYLIIDLGDGYCENLDGSNHRDANWFEFKKYLNNRLQIKTSCMHYYDDIESFKNWLINICEL